MDLGGERIVFKCECPSSGRVVTDRRPVGRIHSLRIARGAAGSFEAALELESPEYARWYGEKICTGVVIRRESRLSATYGPASLWKMGRKARPPTVFLQYETGLIAIPDDLRAAADEIMTKMEPGEAPARTIAKLTMRSGMTLQSYRT